MSLFFSQSQAGANAAARDVAYSVAEAALEADTCSPLDMELMDAPSLGSHGSGNHLFDGMGSWPRQKYRARSFAGRTQPLWQVVEHAKERREREHNASPTPSDDDDDSLVQEITIPAHHHHHSADPSPEETVFFNMQQLNRHLPRLSARDFAAQAEKDAANVVHFRTRSDAQHHDQRGTPSPRSRSRLPSLAQIQAKMNRMSAGSTIDERPPAQVRSDSWDSVDSDGGGPQTPTEEVVMSFNYPFRRPETPDSPQSTSRLAPFLRERTNGRLARPKSMPPLNDSPRREPQRERPATVFSRATAARQFSLPPTPPSTRNTPPLSLRTMRQMSLPATPGTPSRSWKRSDSVTTLIVTPPRIVEHSPMSPTESVTSTASHASSALPIITCTPAIEEDSDEDSEGDVIVFSGDLDSDEDEDEDDDRRDREALGREMRDRLLRRKN